MLVSHLPETRDEPRVTVLFSAGTDVVPPAAFSIWWQEDTRPEIDYFSQGFFTGTRQQVAARQ